MFSATCFKFTTKTLVEHFTHTGKHYFFFLSCINNLNASDNSSKVLVNSTSAVFSIFTFQQAFIKDQLKLWEAFQLPLKLKPYLSTISDLCLLFNFRVQLWNIRLIWIWFITVRINQTLCQQENKQKVKQLKLQIRKRSSDCLMSLIW